MAGANFELSISVEALEQLRALPRDLRKRIGERLTVLDVGFQGDIKKLAGTIDKYRLRVGDYRVLFRLAESKFRCMQ